MRRLLSCLGEVLTEVGEGVSSVILADCFVVLFRTPQELGTRFTMETTQQRTERRARILFSRRERLMQSASLGDAAVGIRALLDQELEVAKRDKALLEGYTLIRQQSSYEEEIGLATWILTRISAEANSQALKEQGPSWPELEAEPSYSIEISRSNPRPLGAFLAAYCIDAPAALARVIDLDWPELPDGSLRSFIQIARDAEAINEAVRQALCASNRRMATVLVGELSSAISTDACLYRAHSSRESRAGKGEVQRHEAARKILEGLQQEIAAHNPLGATEH